MLSSLLFSSPKAEGTEKEPRDEKERREANQREEKREERAASREERGEWIQKSVDRK